MIKRLRQKTIQLNLQSENEVDIDMKTPGNEDSNGLKLAVLLLNLGGPESMAVDNSVTTYLTHLYIALQNLSFFFLWKHIYCIYLLP